MNIKPSQTQVQKKKEKRRPKKITAGYLHNAGLYYLQRFAASKHQFRDVMLRKARKSCAHHPDQDMETCAALIDALVKKFEQSGLLNDEAYTRGVVTSMRRSGKSRKAIALKLKTKGILQDDTQKVLEKYDLDEYEDTQEAELRAALVFARKKRMGPFAAGADGDKNKALAKLARAGFSFEISCSILNMGPEEAEAQTTAICSKQ